VLDNTEPEPLDVARRILEEVEQQEEIGRNISPEGAAAAVIAGIVTADQVSTEKWLDKFLQNAETDPLDVDRLRTDLLAISRETTNELIAPLLPRIERKLGTEDAGEVDRSLATSYKTELWFRKGLSASSSVALIQDMSAGAGIASGFLLRGSDLRADWGDEFVLIANSYVVTEDASIRDTYGAPELSTLCARFLDRTHRIKTILFSSPPTDLDVSISRLDPPPVVDEPLKWVEHLPLLTKSRVYIIGHPGGRDDFQISDGELLDKDDVRLHYTTATEPGSSGSPVFNESWQVIGVHHAGSTAMHRLRGLPGTYAANEGISVLAVVNALNKSAQS
jgi:S1-C subfamily serine protease